MNKRLLVLLPIALLTLTGCNKDGSKDKSGDDGGDVASEIVIDKSVISPFIPEGKTYNSDPYNFDVGGISFNATAGVGLKSAEGTGKTNGLNELGAMQFKKAAGVIKNTTEYPATKIVVEWLATYDSEESKYWPKANAGESTTLSAVTASESSPLAGTDTGKQQHVEPQGKDPFEAKVYSYVSTFNLPAGTKYFSVGDSGGATYITKITITK
ncbi:MAG: hypothetical protein K6E11_01685 [Bacilli bacterium]|nr:hypothetical protein [Bacilli bacterium]